MANGFDTKNLKRSLYGNVVETVETNVGDEREATSTQLIETSQSDPNVKCPNELNVVFSTAISFPNLLDNDGKYKGFDIYNLKNCQEVEKLKQQLIKDGYLAVTDSGETTTNVGMGPPEKIENYQKYNIDKLRCSLNITKYAEDPFALMTNNVWSLDLKNTSDLVFNYKMPPEIVKDINLITYSAITAVLNEKGQKADDKTFINNFLYVVTQNLRGKIGAQAFSFYGIPPNADKKYFLQDLTVEPGNVSFIYFWVAQIFASFSKGTSVLTSGVSGNEGTMIKAFFTGPAFDFFEGQSYATSKVLSDDRIKTGSLLFAFYFLTKIDSINGQSFLKIFNTLQFNFKTYENTKKYFEKTVNDILAVIKKNIFNKVIVNENAYYFNDGSGLESEAFVNVINSPQANAKSFDANEKSLLAKSGEIKKCRENKRNETALRMFYKEGNDNILDGTVPETGLGCDKNTSAWNQAQNNFFDSDKLQQVRKNLTIPFYFKNSIHKKDPIPQKHNVKIDGKPVEIKNLKNRLMQLLAVNEKYIKLTNSGIDYQQDKDLFKVDDDVKQEIVYLLLTSYLLEVPADIFKSAHDILNVGHLLEKKLTTNVDLVLFQRFFFLDPSNTDKNTILFNDSQINYGEKYDYTLSQVLSFYKSTYRYFDIKISFKNGFTLDLDYQVSKFDFTDIIDIEEVNSVKRNNTNSFSDLPPRGLGLQIFSKRGINNELMMLFEKTVFDGVEKKEIDKSLWTDGWKESRAFYLQENKGKKVSDNTMFFGNATIGSIDIYFKVGDKPTSIMDIKDVFGKVNTFTQGFQAQAIIEPNTKYYFFIKAVSVTGLESYASPVYQVELVDDAGAVFPLIEIINFDEKEKRPMTLSLSDKFRVEPALLQQAPNPSTDDIGYLTPVVWSSDDETNPRFKIRLTSKKTGKKVDFNIIYRKKVENEKIGEGTLSPVSVTKDKVLISYKTTKKGDGSEE